MENLPPDLPVEELFACQRRLARSPYLIDRLRTLWVGVQLGERLERCSDRQIGDLLSLVQDGFGLFSPDFAVSEHAKRRLQRSSSEGRKEGWQVIRDAGIELLNAEAALFRTGIPHMLLPFQRDKFASNVFYVRSAAEARACLLQHGFRPPVADSPVLLDAGTNRTVRIVEAVGSEWETP